MDALIPMLRNVLIFIALAIPGFILVKTKTLSDSHSGVLSKLLMYVGLPFLILSSTLGVNFNGEIILSIVIVAILGVALLIALFFISILLVKKSKNSSEQEKEKKINGMMRFSQILSNNGFLGLPLAAAVFGQNTLVFTYLVILNIVTNILLYSLGVYLVSGDKNTIKVKNIALNPVLISFAIGVILNVINLKTTLPEIVTFSDHFKNIVTPLSMTILGMKMGGIKITKMFKSVKMYYVSFIKLVFVPVFCVGITMALNIFLPLGVDIILAVFIAFAMPTAGLASAFADRYNGDTEGAVIYTLGSTILSIITIPLLYWLLTAII